MFIRQCRNPQCSFRFPAASTGSSGRFCPLCGWETDILHFQAHTGAPKGIVHRPEPPLPIVEALLDNIRSTYNVGSMFRAADGAGLRRLYLCGITPTPQNLKVGKTALGAETSIPWEYRRNSVITAQELKNLGYTIFALEASPASQSIFELDSLRNPGPTLLVVGNEICGIDPDILALSDLILRIPMRGQKESLNVSLAFGIAAYTLRFAYKYPPMLSA